MKINELREALKGNKEDEKIVVIEDDDVSLMLGFILGLMATRGKVPYGLLKVVSDILDEYKQVNAETTPNGQSVQA